MIDMLVTKTTDFLYKNKFIFGGARGVMVIIVENGHGDTSSNPGGG